MLQQNLFGFDSQTYNPYANMSDSRKIKKMVSKANIKLLLSKDKGFQKQKSLKSNTKTMISSTYTNVAEAYQQPITTAFNKHGKTSSIAVNSKEVLSTMEEIDISKQQDFITDSMSMAYSMLANKKSADSDFIDDNIRETQEIVTDSSGVESTIKHPALLSKEYANYAKSARVLVAAAVSNGGLKQMNKYVPAEEIEQSSLTGELIQCLTKGVTSKNISVKNILDSIKSGKKNQSAVNSAVNDTMKLVLKDVTSGKASEDISFELQNSHHPLIPLYNIVSTNKGNDKDKASDNASNVGHGELENSPEENIGMKPSDKRWESTEDIMDFETKNNKDHEFFPGGERRYRANEENIDENAMQILAAELYESLKGRFGRLASISPSKRLSKRNIASDLSDKIYLSTTEQKGKHLDVNIIIDTSGSMSGQYIRDAKEVAYVMNILAEKGIFTGNIILSGTRAHAIIALPMPKVLINRITANGGGEGIKEAFRKFKPELKKADFNICLTDGMLTDGHIDKDEMTRQNVSITGAYVAGTKETILEFTGSLNKWFHKSFVRATTRELILALVAQGVMHSKDK